MPKRNRAEGAPTKRELMRRAAANEDGLTDKEMAFAVEYASDWNKTQAAIRAGYSEDTASDAGHELSRKPEVLKMVRRIQDERAKKLGIGVEWATEQFFDLYITARAQNNLKASNAALENIAKIFGAYEKHNHQRNKQPSAAEVEAIKERLKTRGIDVDRITAFSDN